MINKIRVAIPITGTKEWFGGVSYIQHLLKAISFLQKNKRPGLYFIVSEGLLEGFELYRSVIHIFDGIFFVGSDKKRAEEVIGKEFHSFLSFNQMIRNIDFYYPVLSGVFQNVCSASWITDFQHIHLPQYFNPKEFEERSSAFKNMAENARIITVNSEDVKKDFQTLYPHSKAAIRILNMCSFPKEEWFEMNPIDTQEKYNLPNEFMICCNQFWMHKNHLLLFDAIAELNDKGQAVHLVCTGSTDDYRSKEYFQKIMKRVNDLGIEKIIHILGHIPRNDQIQLIRRSLALIQPSLFEGAGLVVEDARMLGKTTILSDLSIHFEQRTEKSFYFDRHDPKKLAQEVNRLLPDLKPGPNLIGEKQAREDTMKSVRILADQFCSLAVEAQFLYKQRIKSLNKALWQVLIDPISPLILNSRQEQFDHFSKNKKKLSSKDGRKPLVSAIVSTYNSKKFIQGCIEDLEAQTLSAFTEIIVINSNSQENEHEIIRDLQKKYDNIKYISTDYRETVYGAWNRGIKAAEGKYITNANTDDRHRRDAFERMARLLDHRPDIALVYADVLKTVHENETFDHHTPAGAYQWHDWNRDILLRDGCFIGPQPMWRKKVHEYYGYFDDTLISSGDYEFWLRISQTYEFHHINMPLGLYLKRPDSIEHRKKKEKIAEDLKIQLMYLDSARKGILIRFNPFKNLTVGAKNFKKIDQEEWAKWIGQIEDVFQNKKAGVPEYLLSTFSFLKQEILSGIGGESNVNQLIEATNQIIFHRSNWLRGSAIKSDEHPDMKKRYPNDLKTIDSTKNKIESPCRPVSKAEGTKKEDGYMKGEKEMKSADELYKDIQPLIENEWNDAAINAMEKLLESYPEYAIAHNDLGVLYLNQGDNDKALQNYEMAVELQPDNITFKKNLADFYYVKMEQVEEALKLYVQVLEKTPDDVETLLITGHICVSLYKFEDAETFYNMVLKIEPYNNEALENLEKLKDIKKTKKVHPSPEEVYEKIGELIENDKKAEAVSELEALIKSNPDYARAYNDLGVLWYELGNKEKALMHYDKAVQLQPENIIFQKNLADYLIVETNQVNKALEIYVRLLEINPTDVETLTTTGHICLSLFRFDDAKTFYHKVLELEPWNEEIRENLEKIQNLKKDHFKEKELDEVYKDTQEMLENGNVLEAVSTLISILEAHPNFALAHNDLGVLYYNTGDKEKALEHYEKAANIKPDNLIFKKNLADLYYMGFGQVEKALKIYVEVLSAHPEDTETLMTTAYICLTIDKKEDAKVFFKRILEIDSDHSEARRNLESLEASQNAL